jgi:hypothetical protein
MRPFCTRRANCAMDKLGWLNSSPSLASIDVVALSGGSRSESSSATAVAQPSPASSPAGSWFSSLSAIGGKLPFFAPAEDDANILGGLSWTKARANAVEPGIIYDSCSESCESLF